MSNVLSPDRGEKLLTSLAITVCRKECPRDYRIIQIRRHHAFAARRGAESKVGLEEVPIDDVALRDRRCPGERALTRLCAATWLPAWPSVPRLNAMFCAGQGCVT
jgi:hypothetical protein